MQPTTPEQWRPIPGREGAYEVSDQGRVRSVRTGRTTLGGVTTRGRRVAYIGQGPGPAKRPVHQLVLEAFVGPRPEGAEGCHNNGDPGDNRLKNLRWDTPSANRHDSVQHGTHYFAHKATCPRGHALVEPNLVRAVKRDGRRSCKACHRAHSRARWRGAPLTQEAADQCYWEVMGAVSLPAAHSVR